MVGDGNDVEDILGNGGVLKKSISRSNGALLVDEDRVGVFYVGTLLNGNEFDSNRTFGSSYSKPLEYTIGSGRMISGICQKRHCMIVLWAHIL
jgi:FKBP-type peptidyl-prolyl cis-trans isomerase